MATFIVLSGVGNVGGFSGLGSLGGSGGCSPGRSAPSYHTSVAEYEKECFTYTAHEHDFSAPPGNDQVGETLRLGLYTGTTHILIGQVLSLPRNSPKSALGNVFRLQQQQHRVVETMKKNLRVNFTKEREGGDLENVVVILRTAIYVLKQTSWFRRFGQHNVVATRCHYNKREVHFVKYRTKSMPFKWMETVI
ncbi:unnamed protein product [Ceratitis capitata]|uniref:(Mediterranean fruit fly) hypothetical protein n=1 Tax=Ceratitis capitata TaxID=7213 RepID=A0A811UBU0_CERCA|nr:unnamed protein product [Ceratitis capitata]